MRWSENHQYEWKNAITESSRYVQPRKCSNLVSTETNERYGRSQKSQIQKRM